MTLVNCGVVGPKSKLVVRKDVLGFQDRINTYKKIFSNILLSMGSKEIGLYDEGRWEGFWGFGTIFIMENFHSIGK